VLNNSGVRDAGGGLFPGQAVLSSSSAPGPIGGILLGGGNYRHAKPDIRRSTNSTYVRAGTRLPLSTVVIGNNRWRPVRLPS
jgi:hypothetical protein